MAKSGFGSTFQLSASAISGSTGMVTEVTDVGLPNPSTDAVETTHHASSAGHREFIPGLVDISEFSVAMNLVPGSTSDLALATAAVSRAVYFFLATVPAATGTWAYSGQCIVTGYDKDDVGTDGKMSATIKCKPTGVITRAAAA